MKRNMIVAVAAAGAVIGGGTLAGVALGAGGGERTDSAELSSNLSVQDGGSLDLGDDATDAADDGSGAAEAGDSVALRAVATALAATPGVVTEVELDRDDDGPRGWEIEIYDESETWHRIVVSEDGGEVLDERTGRSGDDDDDDDWDDDGDDDLAAARSLLAAEASTDAATAIATAESHTGATLREADVDDGHWELELRGEDGSEHEVSISLQSGDVVAEESERDDDGDDGRGDDDRDDRDDRDDDGRDDDGDDDRDDRGDDDGDDDGRDG